LFISPELVPDDMVLSLVKPALFYSKDLKKYVKEEFRTMRVPLKKQYLKNMLNNSIVGGSQIAGETMTIIFVIAIFLNFMIKGGMVFWLALVRGLQIIIHSIII